MRQIIVLLCALLPGTRLIFAQGVQWSHAYGGAGNETAYDVQQTADGGYIVGGTSPGGFFVVRLSAGGDTLWARTYALGNGTYMAREVTGGEFLLAGHRLVALRGQEASFARISASGDTVWTRAYGGPFDQQVYAAVPTSDGGCIAVGQHITGAFAQSYLMAFRIAANGDSLWMITFPGPGAENAYDVAATADDGCVIASSYGSNNNDAYFVRLGSSGNVLWTKQYGDASLVEKAYCIVPADGGGYMAGLATSNGSFLCKLNDSGDTLWTKPVPFGFYRIRPASGGRYILAGQANLDAVLALVDSDGDVVWTKSYGGPQTDLARVAEQTSDGGFIAAGATASFGAGGTDFYVIKTDSAGNTTSVRDVSGVLPERARLFQNYPNPFNPSTTIAYSIPVGRESGVGSMETKLVVYDVLGREVAVLVNEVKAPGVYDVTFDGAGLASGIYVYRLQVGNVSESKKLMLLR